MTKTVLLTLGRLPKALDLARAFASAGWRVVVAEPFAWHLSRVSRAVDKSLQVTAPAIDRHCYLEDLRRIVADERVQLVVPVSEESMHVAALRNLLPLDVDIFAPSQKVLLELHDKLRFIEIAVSYSLPVPRTFPAMSADAAALAESGPHVIKPVFSCSGKGVKILKAGAPLNPDDRNALTIVQRFIPGQVYSSFSIAHKGRSVITSIYKATVVSGTVAVAFERVDHANAVRYWIERFISSADYSGFISFDLIESADGTVSAIECNPRVTSGIHFLDERDVVAAMLAPLTAPPVRFKTKTKFQQFYPCLTETQKSVFQREHAMRNLKHLLSSRDVIWRASDPLPFLLMPMTSYQILAMSIFEGLSFGEAATRDIEWTAPA
ncbi:MAG: ATP-grasp domain-containing protein [Hyphomicrobium sp.]|nr:ATP-grasp domain-containing protein [Hyphomicrobium sp.]